MNDLKKFGLPESELNSIISEIIHNKKISEVILFGSRAKGTNSNGSDIDIALKGADINLDDILDLSIAIDELDLPYKIDLIIYNRIKEKSLIEHIDRVGIVLFQKNFE